jgi:2,4-dienoyl-CoA reductase-like NADH-dependent reductase (Old Yellow Enzyme family)
MSDAAVADTIAAFAKAAVEAKRLGFDLVEIHAAHGYLLDQFFWDATNNRQDKWGGAALDQRVSFAVELIKAVRSAVGPEFPIAVRVSQWKMQDFTARIATTPQEMEAWLLPLVDAGVDLLDCSQRKFWEAEFPEIDGAEGLNFAVWAKTLTGAATISVGSVWSARRFLYQLRCDKLEQEELFMARGKKHTAEQIVKLLRQVEVGVANGKTLPQACKEVEIVEQTYYRWRKEFGGLQVDQARRLKDLEHENAKLKRLVANLSLDNLVLKDIASGNF